MHINLDTETLKPAEARGLISFLSNLFPAQEQLELNWTPQDPAVVEAACLRANPGAVDQLEPATCPGSAAPVVSGQQAQSEPTPINQPATRHRRTKAEIAADEAAAVAAAQASPADPTQAVADSAALAAAASDTTQSATVTPSTALVSADELRALLNGYIAKHSMEEAIGQLQNFGCNRVTEALALDTVKLAALAGALRG